MNIESISEATERALRVRVERIVRPVRASESRKDRVREELLQHMTQTFAVERSVEAAAARLGDPRTLTAELQASVPAWERLLLAGRPTPTWFKRWLMRRDGEATWRYAARNAMGQLGLMIAGGGAALVLAMIVKTATGEPLRMDRLARLGWFFAAFVPMLGFTAFIVPFLGEWAHRALWERTLPRAAAAGACAGAMLLIAGITLWTGWAAIGFLPYRGSALWLVPAAALTAPLIMLTSTRQCVLQRRRYERWTSLDITSPAA